MIRLHWWMFILWQKHPDIINELEKDLKLLRAIILFPDSLHVWSWINCIRDNNKRMKISAFLKFSVVSAVSKTKFLKPNRSMISPVCYCPFSDWDLYGGKHHVCCQEFWHHHHLWHHMWHSFQCCTTSNLHCHWCQGGI